MILEDFLKALRQMTDRRFQGVLWTGIGLTIALLASLTWILLWLLPDTLSIPWYGEVTWVSRLLDGFAVVGMLGLSIFLMVPVASLFMGIFLERIAHAVEEKHYPAAGPARGTRWTEAVMDAVSFFGLIIVVNLFGLIIYLLSNVAAPLVFWVVNGILLGREYFQLVAMRRLGRAGARQLRSRHRLEIWLAGVLMTVPLTIPIVNLCVPVLGAATFTHLYHRLARDLPNR